MHIDVIKTIKYYTSLGIIVAKVRPRTNLFLLVKASVTFSQYVFGVACHCDSLSYYISRQTQKLGKFI